MPIFSRGRVLEKVAPYKLVVDPLNNPTRSLRLLCNSCHWLVGWLAGWRTRTRTRMSAATDWWESDRFVETRTGPVVVQFATEACALCPDTTLQIDSVRKTHDFVWHVDNAFSSTLAEELEVTALPAVLVFHSIDKHKVYQKLRGKEVTRILQAECPPRLVLNAEF